MKGCPVPGRGCGPSTGRGWSRLAVKADATVAAAPEGALVGDDEAAASADVGRHAATGRVGGVHEFTSFGVACVPVRLRR